MLSGFEDRRKKVPPYTEQSVTTVIHDTEPARRQLLVVFSWMTVAVFVIFGTGYFVMGKYWLGALEIFVAAVLVGNCLCFRRYPQRLEQAAKVLVLIVYAMTYVIFIDGGLGGTGNLWILFIPLFSMLLLTERDAKRWLGGYVAGLAAILIAAYFGPLGLEYGWIEVRQTLIVFVTMLLLNAYNEKIKRAAAEAIEKQRAELEALTRTDTLTGAANRLFINDTLKIEMDRASRYGQPLSVIMGDLDRFKQINDRYGHLTGDRVLKQAAELLRSHIRHTDLLGRWGGEEFLVICPGIEKEQAAQMAEKLRRATEEADFGDGLHITASFGVTQYESHRSFQALLQTVDALLYQAKNEGRNRVIHD